LLLEADPPIETSYFVVQPIFIFQTNITVLSMSKLSIQSKIPLDTFISKVLQPDLTFISLCHAMVKYVNVYIYSQTMKFCKMCCVLHFIFNFKSEIINLIFISKSTSKSNFIFFYNFLLFFLMRRKWFDMRILVHSSSSKNDGFPSIQKIANEFQKI
jgi:hypothetical protein